MLGGVGVGKCILIGVGRFWLTVEVVGGLGLGWGRMFLLSVFGL